MFRTLLERSTALSVLASTIAEAWPRHWIDGVRPIHWRALLHQHWELVWMAVIVGVAGLAHGINMFDFPFYENDEGTYMSQAWAVLTQGALAQYTYWYDHAPWGWFQIAGWTRLTGGFYTFGTSIDSGRVLMMLMQMGATFMLYQIARTISGSTLAATVTSLIYALSAYGIYYHRRVLLDNIAAFWMLLSILLLVGGPRLTLTRVWLSACALGISILSKELTIFLIPVMVYLVFERTESSQRWFATTGWTALVGVIFSTYPLMAALKNELFPSGTFLGGDSEHVSLLSSLQLQMSRESDAGLLSFSSAFWQEVMVWAEEEPLLVIGGTAAALLSIVLIRWHRLAGIMGLLTVSLWLFLGRGGVIIGFYLVPLLPLLALNIGLLLNIIVRAVRKLSTRWLAGSSWSWRGAQTGLAALCLVMIIPGYMSTNLGFSGYPLTLWKNNQTGGQERATNWIRLNLPYQSKMIIDAYMWLDLQDPPGSVSSYTNAQWYQAHWYWKVDYDEEVRDKVFHDSWKTVDYVVPTIQLRKHSQFRGLMDVVNGAMEHSTPIAKFDSGGYPVEVRRVNKLHQIPATAHPVLMRSWESYKQRFIENGRVIDPQSNGNTTSEGQSYALLRAVYMDDRETFDRVWQWTQENLQVRDDSLLAWKWGSSQGPDEKGVLDRASAADADQDTALALLFASKRWDPQYKQDAMGIIHSIWEEETVIAGDRRLLVAGDWTGSGAASDARRYIVNPSYLAPYAYRIFAEADPTHPWNEIVDSSYDILSRALDDPKLGGAAGVVPNWLAVDADSGELSRADRLYDEQARRFSYDASRVAWRLTVDWMWFKDNRARDILEAMSLPRKEMRQEGRIAAAYNLNGEPVSDYESISMYSGTLGSLLFGDDPTLAHKTFARKIFQSYNGSLQGAHWGDPDNYYDQNWAWFATIMMDGGLANLWEGERVIDWGHVFPEYLSDP